MVRKQTLWKAKKVNFDSKTAVSINALRSNKKLYLQTFWRWSALQVVFLSLNMSNNSTNIASSGYWANVAALSFKFEAVRLLFGPSTLRRTQIAPLWSQIWNLGPQICLIPEKSNVIVELTFPPFQITLRDGVKDERKTTDGIKTGLKIIQLWIQHWNKAAWWESIEKVLFGHFWWAILLGLF